MFDNGIVEKSINTIRFLSADAVQKASSGHPGLPMADAPLAFLLYTKIMRHNPENPNWINRDRFILSAGHGSMLLYSILHLTGYKISLDDLKNFRQWGSITPGHPEYGVTEGVETTTGPLGQGFGNAVGMSVASKFMAAKFNKENIMLIDHFIYVLVSDGDMMEGITHEVASFAGHNKLSNLIVFYDDNNITIDGRTSLAFSEDVPKRYEAYGWHVQKVDDMNNIEALEKAVEEAKKDERPSFIAVKSIIGFGSPNKEDTSTAHGSPLGDDEIKLAKENLGFPSDQTFYVSPEVREYFSSKKNAFKKYNEDWDELSLEYKDKYPDEYKFLQQVENGNFGDEWIEVLPKFENYGEKMATRSASGKVINAIAEKLPMLIGGSADLAPSNNTKIEDESNFSAGDYAGRNFHFGIREHAMGAILNGMALYKSVIPYGGTFLVFSDYMRPSLRLAALSKINPIFIYTHDSIGLGEDGPTHQPIEQLASLRAIPNFTVIRPADANETVYAWKIAVKHKNGPVALLFTRQKLEVIDRSKYKSANGVEKGAYILKDSEGTPDILLMASGSEVGIALSVSELLDKEDVKSQVISFPSWELFEEQDAEYKESVLPKEVKARISIEAGVSQGWEKYLGENGKAISIEKFGHSAPYQKVFEEYGFSPEDILKAAKGILAGLKTRK